jgi:hypothetical protein
MEAETVKICVVTYLWEMSLATTLQGVYFIFMYFAATCFGPCWPSLGEIHSYSRKLPHPQRICCFVLQVSLIMYVDKYCRCPF